MSTGIQFDAEKAQQVLRLYITPDVVEQRRRVLELLQLRSGERVLDIGSGPGLLAAEMAAVVGSSGSVQGIDISESMVEMARARNAEQPLAGWLEFRVGEATRLPFPDGSFDVAISTQVYEYVSDIAAALAEVYRVLRPGGRALILDSDWGSLVWHSSDQGRMRHILAAWDEHLHDPWLPRTLAPRLRTAGFVMQHQELIPLFNPDYHVNTYSHGLMNFISGFVIGRHQLSSHEVSAWADDLRQLGAAGQYFFSLNRYVFVASRPA